MKNITSFTALIICVIFSLVALQAQEKSVAGLYNEGLGLLKSKDYIGGLALMEQALAKAGPDDEKVITLAKKNIAIAAYNAGNAELKNKGYDNAEALFNKGIMHNPTNSSNYEGLARVNNDKGDKIGAVKGYLDAANKAIEEGKPDKAPKRVKRAETIVGKLFVGKDYETAIAAGQAFIAIKPDVAEVHYYTSRSYAESGNADKALEHASQAITLAGTEAGDKYYYAQATQFEALGQKSEAIAAYKKISGEKYGKQAEYKISELGG